MIGRHAHILRRPKKPRAVVCLLSERAIRHRDRTLPQQQKRRSSSAPQAPGELEQHSMSSIDYSRFLRARCRANSAKHRHRPDHAALTESRITSHSSASNHPVLPETFPCSVGREKPCNIAEKLENSGAQGSGNPESVMDPCCFRCSQGILQRRVRTGLAPPPLSLENKS